MPTPKEPFDIEWNGIDYAVFPEEENVYTIFKDGQEYIKIIKDTENSWMRLDSETELPRFEADDEINALGKLIIATEQQG